MTRKEGYPTKMMEIPINKVRPNKYNTRVQNEVNIESLAQKIKQYGFTSVLIAYEKDDEYILLSGHRRRVAAELVGIKTLPVNVVPRPESIEVERFIIATLQGEFKDWTKYEWGRVVYERWIRAGKPDVSVFMMDAAISTKYKRKSEVTWVLQAFEKLPADILERMRLGELSFEVMVRLAEWVAQLEKRKPEVVKEFSTHTVARIMVDKLERKMITHGDLQRTSVFNLATIDQLKGFLGDQDYTGIRLFDEIDFGRKNVTDRHRATLVSVDKSRVHTKVLDPRTAEEWEGCIRCLELYEKALSKKINELENMAFNKEADVAKVSTLF